MLNKLKKAIVLMVINPKLFCLKVYNKFIGKKDLYENRFKSVDGIHISYPYFANKLDAYIESFLCDIDRKKIDKIKYIVNYLDNHINVIFKLYQKEKVVDYHSVLLRYKKYGIIEFKELITNEKIFENRIKALIKTKQNKISQTEYDKAKKSYLFKNHELIIYLTNYNKKGSISSIALNYCEFEDCLVNLFKLNDKTFDTTTTKPLKPSKKLVAFTFDDGPCSHTLDILDILDEFNAKATFFVVGSCMKANNSIILETIQRGHEVGNHTTNHARLSKLSKKQISRNLEDNDKLYYNITEEHMMTFRPPYGAYNKNVQKVANMPIILWSADSEDWELLDAKKVVARVLNEISEGGIVLLHDIHPTTVEAVRILLPILYADNYEVVSVKKLFEAYGIIPENGQIYNKLNKYKPEDF